MANNPLIVRLPGQRNEKLATVSVRPFDSGIQKRTPEWMVGFSQLGEGFLGGTAAIKLGIGAKILAMLYDKIKAYSSVDKLSSFTELFGWNAEAYRFVNGDMAGTLLTSASVQHSPLTLMIPAGSFAANAEEAMYKGYLIECITIIRLGYIRGILNILQTIVFKNCRITRFQQQLDRLILHCTILEKITMMTVFNQDGSIAGFGVGNVNIQRNQHSGRSMPSGFQFF